MAIVECYAGSRYPERPRALLWERERMALEEVERQWRTPRGLVFIVRTVGGRRFRLTYDEATGAVHSGAWRVQALEDAHPIYF
jgi:hypothetical protein